MLSFKKMLSAIKRWYEGEWISREPEHSPGLVIFLMPLNKRHWTSRAAHRLVEFYLEHWKWIWSAILIIVGWIVTRI